MSVPDIPNILSDGPVGTEITGFGYVDQCFSLPAFEIRIEGAKAAPTVHIGSKVFQYKVLIVLLN